MTNRLLLAAVGLSLCGCASLRLDADRARRTEQAVHAAVEAYCRISQADREAFRQALAERHGVVLPRVITCPGDTDGRPEAATQA